jgi:hypothetical protein
VTHERWFSRADKRARTPEDRRRVTQIRRGSGFSGNALRDAGALAVRRWLYL